MVEDVVIRGDGRGTSGYGLSFCHLRFSSPKDNLNIRCNNSSSSVPKVVALLAQTFPDHPPKETPLMNSATRFLAGLDDRD